ncbi:MAG: tetratricopeptide repeat protein [Hyphomicrobiaceae bacterium]
MRVRPTTLLGIALVLSLNVLLSLGARVAAAADDPPEQIVDPRSSLGGYLAGRVAAKDHDHAAAATFYEKVLQHDPDNAMLLAVALEVEASEANWARAEVLSRRLVAVRPASACASGPPAVCRASRIAHTLLGIIAFKAGGYTEAEQHFQDAGIPSVASAWAIQAQGRTDDALAAIDGAKLSETFLRYNRALLADVAGRTAEASAAYSRIWKTDQRVVRIALAYAHHAASAGDAKLAQSVLSSHMEATKAHRHPLAVALQAEIRARRPVRLLVASPEDGMAELFYWLGLVEVDRWQQSIANDRVLGEDSRESVLRLAIAHLQISLYLNPNSAFTLLSMADAQEAAKRYEAANEAYGRIDKGKSIEVLVDIRKATNLNRLERVAEAQALLEDLARRHPRDIRPVEALGNLMRDHKRYAEAVTYYDKAIALIGRPERAHWTFFFRRGASYERLKKLRQAEADLQRSLRLKGDEPSTLNYLGYTWIDNNRNLRKGLKLIEQAVRLRPNDGAIVDSLGWAHYRLGNFQEAVKHLEYAVGLVPSDSTLNDHLGDAYWRVGRKREARFQWNHALKLDPEPEAVEKIRQKLEKGLPATQPQLKRRKDPVSAERPKRRSAGNTKQP